MLNSKRNTIQADPRTWAQQSAHVFENVHFELLSLHDKSLRANGEEYDFNTELTFINCSIDIFNSATLLVGKTIRFKNCQIGDLFCYSTYFFGGLEVEGCTITRQTSFSAGVHNNRNYPFEVINCRFEGYADFFDVYFSGPVRIVGNSFTGGTNLNIYLQVPFGIDEGIPCLVANNLGDLSKYADDDPMRPKK